MTPAAALLLAATAAGAPGGPPPDREPGGPRVLMIGSPREGPMAAVAAALRERGLEVGSSDGLEGPPPWRTGVVLLGRPPRDGGEGERWRGILAGFLRAGGRAAAPPGPAGEVLAAAAGEGPILGAVVAIPDAGAAAAAAGLLAPARTAVPHPADRPDPAVAPELHRLAPAGRVPSLPGRTLAYLGFVALALAGAALLARRRGFGSLRAGAVLAGVAAGGTALLFLPGLRGEAIRVDRFTVIERAAPGAAGVRRVELVRVERVRGGGEAGIALDPGAAWAEILYEAGGGAGARWSAGEATVDLPAPGTRALLAGAAGGEAPPAGAPPLARIRVEGDRAWRLPPSGDRGEPAGPGEPLRRVLGGLRREGDPRLALAGELLAGLLRPLPGAGPLRVEIPPEGPLAEVIHEEP